MSYNTEKAQGGLLGWVDARFPLTKMWREHLSEYYAPKNFNWWYYFGSLALMVLVIQIISGIWLTFNFKPTGQRPSPRSNSSCVTWNGAG